ncbi:hypothetical protein J6590_009829 [Homalodisca vitripennis]|nr:hypothetical protein J6590_009829 [Homalodisca vitripennis]
MKTEDRINVYTQRRQLTIPLLNRVPEATERIGGLEYLRDVSSEVLPKLPVTNPSIVSDTTCFLYPDFTSFLALTLFNYII